MIESIEKEFIKVFNNMCRKDNNIYSWCVYKTFEGLQIDIYFKNYNNEIFNLHRIMSSLELSGITKSDAHDYAKYIYEEMIYKNIEHNSFRYNNEKDI